MNLCACLGLVLVGCCAGCSIDGVDNVFGRGSGASSQGGRPSEGGAPSEGGSRPETTVTTGTPDTTVTTTGQTNTSTVTSGPTTTTTTNGPPTGPTVFCNDLPCNQGEVCCYYQFEAGVDYCSAPGSCPADDGWVEHSCNGPDDCPGECCGVYGDNGWGPIQCQASCSNEQFELCFDDPTACDFGTCTPSAGLGVGYSYCG